MYLDFYVSYVLLRRVFHGIAKDVNRLSRAAYTPCLTGTDHKIPTHRLLFCGTMAIAHVATEYVFSDFLLKEPNESKYKGVRLDLAIDKLVTFVAVGLPLLLISLAFAQEVSVGK